MKTKVIFIERKFWEFVSIEKVFRQIAKNLSEKKYDYEFYKLTYGNSLIGLLKNLLLFKKKTAKIYHITGHIHYIALRLPVKTTVLTIHDLGFIHANKGIKRYILKKLYLDLPVKRLKYVTTISEATRQEILFHTNCDKNKIRVIENPLTEGFNNAEKLVFKKNCPRILQIGTAPHKNLNRLIKALKGINCKLDIVGKLNEDLLNLLKANEIRYENSFELNDEQILSKYRETDIVAFCSTFEGFGLPIIEGQAMQKPVITSNISPLKEVAGKGAILVNPNNYYQIRKGIQKIIEDKELRLKLIEDGLENIKRFDSKNISAKYEDLYEEVLST